MDILLLFTLLSDETVMDILGFDGKVIRIAGQHIVDSLFFIIYDFFSVELLINGSLPEWLLCLKQRRRSCYVYLLLHFYDDYKLWYIMGFPRSARHLFQNTYYHISLLRKWRRVFPIYLLLRVHKSDIQPLLGHGITLKHIGKYWYAFWYPWLRHQGSGFNECLSPYCPHSDVHK